MELYPIMRDIRPTHAVIDLTALNHNLHEIRKKIGSAKIMAIVKANAYGHGILEVTRQAIRSGVEYIGVGFLEEGIFLRQHDVDIPILVMGGILGYQIKKFVQNDLDVTVSSLELARHIDAEVSHQKVRVHLKIDTGMERIGVSHLHAIPFVREVRKLSNLDIVGLYSHFATADEPDDAFAHAQHERYETLVTALAKEGLDIPLKHISNTGAVGHLPEASYDMVRPGIGMYGIPPSNSAQGWNLRPVLSLHSKVVFIKRVPAQTGISYGHLYRTKEETTIVTVPIGYGDGYSRLLSNRASVLIRGKRYPVVGAVCMDQIMVDVGQDRVSIGDEVVLIGRSDSETITASALAEIIGTIPYEVTCMINARVPRLYVDGSSYLPRAPE